MNRKEINKITKITTELSPGRVIVKISALTAKGTLFSYYNSDGISHSKTAMQLNSLLRRKNSRFIKQKEEGYKIIYNLK